MGREATCICHWARTKCQVKALIEPPFLILRGGLQKRLPIAQLKKVQAAGGRLTFEFDREVVALDLGAGRAQHWVDALLKPPPSLAKKLGITSEITVWMIGKANDEALKDALAEAKKVSSRSGELILARVETPGDLEVALVRTSDALNRSTPIWFIYPKGSGHALNEAMVRAAGLAAGIVDTKVAAVSATLTALRFVKRKV